ncbi:MAG: hypothetical protein AAF702_03780 [Chloroflexota bacterium]
MHEPISQRNPTRSLLSAVLWVLVATAILLLWVFFIRSGHLQVPIDYESVKELGIDPFHLGAGIQELLGPLILLLLLSRTGLFKRVVSGELRSGDSVWLILLMVAIHLIYMLFQGWLIETISVQITSGLFVVLVAGMLGGWQAGLIVGGTATLSLAYLNYAVWGEPHPFNLNEYLGWQVLQSIDVMVALWFGAVVGITSEVLPSRQRFNIWPTVTIGLVSSLITAAAIFFTRAESYFFMEILLSGLIASILAWAAFSLMARSVQNEALRQQAESAQLDLAEANLNLAQTRLALT